MRTITHALLFTVLVSITHAFVCFSEYEVSWCIGADCSHSYTFSASHFHNKLLQFFKTGKRPPLKEAYFITRTPPDFLKQMVDECPAVPTLSYALLALARASIGDAPQTEKHKAAVYEIVNYLKPLQQQIMMNSGPVNDALLLIELEQQRPQMNSTILLFHAPSCGASTSLPQELFPQIPDAKIDLAQIQHDC